MTVQQLISILEDVDDPAGTEVILAVDGIAKEIKILCVDVYKSYNVDYIENGIYKEQVSILGE